MSFRTTDQVLIYCYITGPTSLRKLTEPGSAYKPEKNYQFLSTNWPLVETGNWKKSYTKEIKTSQILSKLGLERFINPLCVINDHRPEGSL